MQMAKRPVRLLLNNLTTFIYRWIVCVVNPYFTAELVALENVDNAKEKVTDEGVEEPLPEGIWNSPSEYICSIHGYVIENAAQDLVTDFIVV